MQNQAESSASGQRLHTRRDFLQASLVGTCAFVFCTSRREAEGETTPSTSHLTDAHLQQILNWTAAEQEAASLASRKLQQDLDAAIKAGDRHFRIPPGDYTDWQPDNYPGHHAILVVKGASDMEIDATGATFWSSGSQSGSAVIFADCQNCVVQGMTADMLKSPFIQGLVSEIIPGGFGHGRDKIIIDLEKGFYTPGMPGAQGVGRTWQLRKDGRVIALPENLDPNVDEAVADGKVAWARRGNSTPVEIGDRLSVHVMNGCGGVVLQGCSAMQIVDLTVFSASAFCVWESGKRCPGGNTYTRLKIVPRPGSTRIGVGAMDGFHSFHQKKGPKLIDCEISRVHDDGVNIHGFVNVVLQKLAANKYVLASVSGRDYEVGTELIFNRAPAMQPAGRAKISAWEPFGDAQGQVLYAGMQKRFKEELRVDIRDVIEPEFNVVSFDPPVDLDVLDMACSQEYCGRGSHIKNLSIHTGCNRGVLLKGPDSTVENSRFENIDFGGLALATSLNTFLEGGFPCNSKIINNTFEQCGERVFGFSFQNGVVWSCLGAISLSPCLPPHYQEAFLYLSPCIVYQNIEVSGNHINNTCGIPIFIGNSSHVTVANNVITKPLQAVAEKLKYLDLTRAGIIKPKYSPPVSAELLPVLKEPFYGIFISASENVRLIGNRVKDAPAHFKGLVGIGPWSRDIRVD